VTTFSAWGQAAWPDALTLKDGTAVRSREEFEQRRRPELLELFAENVYGRTPRGILPVRVIQSSSAPALDGLAIRRQITVAVGVHGERVWHVLLYTPARAKGPVPVIVGLNFDGNQTVDGDPGIELHDTWVRDPRLSTTPLSTELANHVLVPADAATRGKAAAQWQVKMIVQRGYGLATMYGGEIEPDFVAGIGYGVRPLLFDPTQRLPKADDWGAIGAWGWGMSRMLDVLAEDPRVDRTRLIAFGFSRFGKTALWASAQDKRFALVLSNESGQAGATLSHRKVGESIDHMMLTFPYWFAPNYSHYLGRTENLPVDGHLLLALIAPRPLYVGSAVDDPFSDPQGEFMAAQAASGVYALYGLQGVPPGPMPGVSRPVGDTLRYHERPGGHDVTAYDWEQYLDFADRELGR
jgi:hypothetical protein